LTGDDFRDALKWSLIAVVIVALWFEVLNVRKARAAIAAKPGVSVIQTERAPSDDIRPVWIIVVYNEKFIGITEFVFESYEECQIFSAELRKQLGLHLKPACYLRWLKGGRMSEGNVM